MGDIAGNLGYVMAMLPDILLGVFTGKTQSLNIKDNLLPIASIVAGMFGAESAAEDAPYRSRRGEPAEQGRA